MAKGAMFLMVKATEVNKLLERNEIEVDDLILQVNQVLAMMDAHEQMDIHGALSSDGINRVYAIRNKITIHPHAKEHIVWSYFKHRISGKDSLSDDLIQEMLQEYEENKFLAVESLFVDSLKNDVLSLSQIEVAENILSGKAFLKESISFKCREIIRSGNSLNADEVSKLIELRAFSTLDFALDKKAITMEGLERFVEPVNSEKDRKIKLVLFQKANKIKAE